ncbi:MAG: hypothetical protein PWP20_1385 [Eubacteriaceae bacterium]|jgi:DNA-binding LytR/AlgR family response regulator|nr:hypothetical protein [Eubacteriaceae bacterium]
MFKIAICDDEPVITSQLEEILYNNRELFPYDIEIDVFYSCDHLASYMENSNDFDLLFLDIEMDGLNGLELGRIIRNQLDNQSLQIVYVSGKEDYYKELFDVRPMHFLLKPVDPDSLIQDVNLAMKLTNRYKQFFVYKKSSKIYKVRIKDILYFQSINREIRILTTRGDDIFYGKLKDLSPQLKDFQFMQIHKSYLVNYAQIIEFRYDRIKLANSEILPISQAKRKKIRELQLKYEMIE